MDRFWTKVEKTDSCWLWTGGTTRGYGMFWLNGRNHGAHRVSWELAYGPAPEGLVVRHSCDNPPCVNPDHLLVGTQADNAADRDSRGRHASQKKTHCPKGHPLEHKRGDGKRFCLECQRAYDRMRKGRRGK